MYTYISPQDTPLLFAAFCSFGLVLLVDASFCVAAIVRRGTKQLAAVLIHHIGFLVWVIRILASHSIYISGTSLILSLLELCLPLRLAVHCRYPRRNTTKVRTQLLVFSLDMFGSGGGTFVAAVLFCLALADKVNTTPRIQRDVLWTGLPCFVYWFGQLFTVHRYSLRSLLQNLVDCERQTCLDRTGGIPSDAGVSDCQRDDEHEPPIP